ncbi:ATP-dependent DNA helicase [Streptomyces rapamycinicus]|uniref:DNA 3'-5' helicase n=1 Tax=Streptomyces rapamycinicus TaxID=1226757 RepID=A0ABR6LK33_9ACTN|nr:ATP-dependent DNA helicase [Streptomyces rapamycinicus]AGP55158.1 ATP-dependent DNA helicase [Streptomyces rapamycinicus NRRL 5491]MBB4782696.1 DNA helicase-2/ATP-dependent DNA helicase PcrA [Streptomyces rapamycinicus]UTO63180.1 ATP-dependent helicase [Streptomyces rapamycinicus]UTP31138.1 ATP-dependent helicase [Streptomyces rapamycinicus NRRL 5491]
MSARITDPEELKELLGIPFTPEQVACITAPPAPQVIVAGAGSGKTTVMAARVVWLVGTGQVAPDRVLGLTFTNKAAGELAERVRKALVTAGIVDPDPDPGATEEAPGDPVISTYHAFAGQLLKDHGLRVGLEPSARLLADATRFQLAARVLRSAPGPYPALTRPFADLVTDLLALDAELAEHLVPTGRLRAYDTELLRTLEGTRLTNEALRKVPEAARARQELLGLVEAYREEKRRRDLLDFGDQIAHSATLALDHPEVGRILREQFAVVLLDEYQDTSVAQRLLLSGLFGGGTGHPVTAVGDPCQAIYGWRGASVANLDDFPEHFPHADGRPAERFALSENRRSGGRLLDLANGLAAPLRAMHEGVEALRPAPGAERDGAVRCALLPTHAEELVWLADSIAHLVRTGTPPAEIAVLCRTAGDFAQIQGALVERDVPVEVVGLSGLLHLPEVADLVAVCEVLQDPGANAALVRLLTGPRWRIGPRDLALLGRRARAVVSYGGQDGAEDDPDRRLAEAVEGTDPAEVISLADALDTFLEAGGGPDDGLPFSADARVRFARLAAELRELRRSLADPLMDVLHRVLATTGLEVELSASPHALAARRRETLGNFLDVAAAFAGREGGAAVDGEATLQGFLGFLRTAAQYEKGLDNALPGGENTVKVLTAHKAKGLEWDVVAVPGLVAKQFPSEQSRESWTANAKVLPHELRGDARTLPDVTAWDSKGIAAFKDAMKGHQRTEELRLGYVTFTRPRSLLLGSGHWWGPTQKRPRGPSGFLDALREHCEAGYGEIEAWAEPPEEGAENPALRESAADRAWPLPLDPAALRHRRRAADVVLAHLARIETEGEEPTARDEEHSPADADLFPEPPEELEPPEDPEWPEPPEDPYGSYEDEPYDDAPHPGPYGAPEPGAPEPDVPEITSEAAEDEPTPEEARLIGSWDRDLDALAGELRRARETVHEVPLPGTLTASQLLRLAADPDGFARELARPMPRPPRPAARRGTRFHAWVESRFEALPLPFLGPDELPGGEDDEAEIADERDLTALKEAFARTPYARRTPYRVEVPVQLTLAGRTIRGRIDAVYRESGTGSDDGPRYEIVDWKTGRSQDADPLQLAIYRVAWAEQHGLPLSAVTAAFVYVRSGEVVRPAGLPGRAGLERVLLGEPGDAEVGGNVDVGGNVEAGGKADAGGDGDGDGGDRDADIGGDGDADATGNDRIDAGTVTESEHT